MDTTSEVLAKFAIQLILITLTFNAVANTLKAVKELVSKLKSMCKNKSSKVEPTMQTTKTEKFENKLWKPR